MSNPTRTVSAQDGLNRSNPPAERVKLGDRLEEQANSINAIIDAINAAGVAGLSVNVSNKVTPPSDF
jgi:hypothetical protein